MDSEILQLIKEMGTTMTLIRKTAGVMNPETRTIDSATQDHTVNGKIISYKKGLVDGTIIQKTDKMAILAGKGITAIPTVKDRIKDDSTTYEVVDVHTIRKGATIIAYVCQVRI